MCRVTAKTRGVYAKQLTLRHTKDDTHIGLEAITKVTVNSIINLKRIKKGHILIYLNDLGG